MIAVFLGAVFLGFLASKRNPLYAIILSTGPLIIVVIEFLLRNYYLSPVVILFIAAFVPLGIPTGTGSPLVLSLIAAAGFVALWLLKMIIVEKRIQIMPSTVNPPLLGFVAATIIAWGWSILLRDPLVHVPRTFPIVQAAATFVIVLLPMVSLLVGNSIHTLQPLKVLVGVMLVAGVLGMVKNFTNLPLPVDTNGMYNMWIVSLCIGLAVYDRKLGWREKAGLIVLGVSVLYFGFGLHKDWLSGWLPAFVVVGVLSFMRSKRIGVVFLVVTAFVLIFFYGAGSFQSEEQGSGLTRFAAWAINWRITGQHLLFGTGPAGYTIYYLTYFPTEAMATHNNYLDIFAQTGLVGSVFCLWLFGAFVWTGYRLCARVKGRGDFIEALANAAFAGTIGCIVIMGFGDWLFPFAYTQTIAGFNYAVYNWLFMGTILVLDQITQNKPGVKLEEMGQQQKELNP